jgi:hypothetical protein
VRAANARHEDLLHARRRVGAFSAVDVELPASGGGTWPLRLSRSADGSTRVTVMPEEQR